MATYLLTWNPARWHWENPQECIAAIEDTGFYEDLWSCGVTKRIMPGDRVFLMRLGKEPRGIMAAGHAVSKVQEGPHWNTQAREQGKTALHIRVRFETLLDPDKGIFPRARLMTGVYAKINWSPQASGRLIPNDIAARLEKDWAQFLGRPVPPKMIVYAEEAEVDEAYYEGAKKQIWVNVYERSTAAREACIQHYGHNCFICGFNFEERYGQIGADFIHVHHLKPLSEVGKGYKLHPVKDLRPLCPNCHAMLHQQKPAYSIGKLKSFLRTKSKRNS